MPHVPVKIYLVMISWFFLLGENHVGFAETDPPEPDAVFTHTSEMLFENNFTSLEENSLFLLERDPVWNDVFFPCPILFYLHHKNYFVKIMS